jgi:hypothetical protein
LLDKVIVFYYGKGLRETIYGHIFSLNLVYRNFVIFVDLSKPEIVDIDIL